MARIVFHGNDDHKTFSNNVFISNVITSAGIILLYFPLSIGLTFYQKWFLKDFHFPLLVVASHLVTKFLAASVCRSVWRCWTRRSRVRLDWQNTIRKIAPLGFASGLDIAFSNWGIELITVSLYTMTKSSSIVFILIFALLFKLEEKSWSLFLTVIMISGGLFFFTYKAAQFNAVGFVLVLFASFCSGLRWALTQFLMQKSELGLTNPIDVMYYVQPWMLLFVFPVAIVFEAGPAVESWRSLNLPEDSGVVGTRIGSVFIGGLIALAMELSEFLVVSRMSSLSLSVAGIFKEVCTLTLAIEWNGDIVTKLNFVGLLLCLSGIGLHVTRRSMRDVKKSSIGNDEASANFPSDPEKRKLWVQAIKRDNWQPKKYSRICSRHFKEEDFDRSPFYSKLKKGVTPTIFDSFPEHMRNKQSQPRRTIKRHSSPLKDKRSPSKKKLKRMLQSKEASINDLETRLELTSSELCSATTSLTTTSELLAKKRKQIKHLRQKCRRYNKKNCVLQNIILELKDKCLLADEYANILGKLSKTSAALLRRQQMKSVNPKLVKIYDERLKAFSITLNFLSPKAYDFVRDQFDTCLPHRRTVGKWYTTVNCSAGFSTEVFRVLKEKSKDRQLMFALMFDGMAIRKSLDWDGSKVYGYVDFGHEMDDEETPLAQEAIVFHLVGINSSWKIPIGYFLINSITGEQLFNLTCIALRLLKEAGVKVTSITCDGEAHNITMLKKLGCVFDDPSNITAKFSFEESEYLGFLDPCHLLKLVRNTLHDYSCLIDGDGSVIKWEYFEKLHQLQISEGLKLGNKLASSHVHYQNQKMKVKLASQLLSESVGDALQYCKEKNMSGFEKCEGTIKFVKIFNSLFDILNSRNIHTKGFKQALNPLNIDKVKQFLDQSKRYLLTLTCENGKSIFKSRRKLGFLGFLLCIESTISFYHKYIEDEKALKYFPTYKISQDHIERLFSYIRSRGGRNNNPSSKDFKFAVRAILVHKQLHENSASSTNAIPLDKINILGIHRTTSCPVEEINNTCTRNRMLDAEGDRTEFQNVSEVDSEEICLQQFNTHHIPDYLDVIEITNVSRDIVEYIAGFIIRRLNSNLKCEGCLAAIEKKSRQDNVSTLISVKDRGGLMLPDNDVVEVCIICEKLFRARERKKKITKVSSKSFLALVMAECIGKNFFGITDHFLYEQSHYSLLLNGITNLYFKVRMHHYLKINNDQIHAVKIRTKLNKNILFLGQ